MAIDDSGGAERRCGRLCRLARSGGGRWSACLQPSFPRQRPTGGAHALALQSLRVALLA